ncbi:CBM35 domain-containing protein [Homoserinibacter sp. YIM 151385]|uniref:CBM35 domain-containing protein n=1 Tax=Homoserinibacter sp. YIM 151385 TaxID=2985506 RepID=UPI0022F111E1|nr:CBM35 domain-containing protein [Homoserinibacter sp. YIM 151385]WBU37502.1 carbohydrate-binding protein [Homoserinibacter sp. YIM 151385]
MTVQSRMSRRALALLVATGVMSSALLALGASPAHAATTRYEAEQASRSGGAVVSTEHGGYSGTGFVGGYTDGNKGAATTSFAVSTTASGTHALGLRYANGTGSAKTLTLVVDGAAQQIDLGATSGWSSWATRTVSVSLTAGSHTIAYRFGTADSGNVNLDALDVTTPSGSGTGTGADYAAGPVFEAESATLTGGTAVSTEHAGFSGTGFVGGYTDGSKGTATTTFKVRVAAAGSKTLAFRYANGTGSAKTLTLLVDGAAQGQLSLPATASWGTWSTATATATLSAGDRDVALRFGAADSGNVNLDRLEVSADTPPQPAGPGEAELAYRSGGATTATAVAGFTGSGYVQGLTQPGARVIRTLAMPAASTATVTIRFQAASARTLDLLVNARRAATVTLPAGSGWRTVTASVPVRAGVNTVGLRAATAGADVQLDSIAVAGEGSLAARGATTPYRQYEAEGGTTNGTVLAASRVYRTVQAESSGRRAVRLDAAGEQVSITLAAPASGLVIRHSLPDSADGTGRTAPIAIYAGSTKLTDLTLSSKHAWVYGGYPFDNTVSGGLAHRFYDEARVVIPAQPSGTVIRLQIDQAVVPYIDIDLVEAEAVPPALTAPAGAVSIASHGATPGGGDDTAAITAAVAAAKSAGAPVWVPAGTFQVSTAIQLSGVTVLGAGPWHSTILGTGNAGGFYATGGGVTIADLAIQGSATQREDSAGQAAIEGDFASETLIQNIWIQHTKVGLWVRPGSKDVLAVGLRVRDTYADGVNFRDGVRNSQVVQSTFRNTGDDGLAMWSDGSPVQDSVFAFNTVQAPALSNGLAVYGGGGGNRVEDNLVADTVEAAAGIAVSTRFGVPFTGTTTVQRNTLTRTGSMETNWNTRLPGLWIYADVHAIDAPVVIRDNAIADSTYAGVLLSWQKSIQQVSFRDVAITGSGTYGIEIHASGSASFTNTSVSGSGTGGLLNDGGFTVNRVSGNSGF